MKYPTCRTLLRYSLSVIAILVALVPQVFAQTTASLTGTVVDNTGAVIPNAAVILTDQNSRDRRELNTNGSGFFQLCRHQTRKIHLGCNCTRFSKTGTDWYFS